MIVYCSIVFRLTDGHIHLNKHKCLFNLMSNCMWMNRETDMNTYHGLMIKYLGEMINQDEWMNK